MQSPIEKTTVLPAKPPRSLGVASPPLSANSISSAQQSERRENDINQRRTSIVTSLPARNNASQFKSDVAPARAFGSRSPTAETTSNIPFENSSSGPQLSRPPQLPLRSKEPVNSLKTSDSPPAPPLAPRPPQASSDFSPPEKLNGVQPALVPVQASRLPQVSSYSNDSTSSTTTAIPRAIAPVLAPRPKSAFDAPQLGPSVAGPSIDRSPPPLVQAKDETPKRVDAKELPEVDSLRSWSDKTKSFTVKAAFLGLSNQKIHLWKENGVKIAVPLEKMSEGDLMYLEGIGVDVGKKPDLDKPKVKDTIVGPSFISTSRIPPMPELKNTPFPVSFGEAFKPDTPKNHNTKTDTVFEVQTQKSKEYVEPRGPKTLHPTKDESKYSVNGFDWHVFFLSKSMAASSAEKYAIKFVEEGIERDMVLGQNPIGRDVLRDLGLKEGDIFRILGPTKSTSMIGDFDTKPTSVFHSPALSNASTSLFDSVKSNAVDDPWASITNWPGAASDPKVLEMEKNLEKKNLERLDSLLAQKVQNSAEAPAMSFSKEREREEQLRKDEELARELQQQELRAAGVAPPASLRKPSRTNTASTSDPWTQTFSSPTSASSKIENQPQQSSVSRSSTSSALVSSTSTPTINRERRRTKVQTDTVDPNALFEAAKVVERQSMTEQHLIRSSGNTNFNSVFETTAASTPTSQHLSKSTRSTPLASAVANSGPSVLPISTSSSIRPSMTPLIPVPTAVVPVSVRVTDGGGPPPSITNAEPSWKQATSSNPFPNAVRTTSGMTPVVGMTVNPSSMSVGMNNVTPLSNSVPAFNPVFQQSTPMYPPSQPIMNNTMNSDSSRQNMMPVQSRTATSTVNSPMVSGPRILPSDAVFNAANRQSSFSAIPIASSLQNSPMVNPTNMTNPAFFGGASPAMNPNGVNFANNAAIQAPNMMANMNMAINSIPMQSNFMAPSMQQNAQPMNVNGGDRYAVFRDPDTIGTQSLFQNPAVPMQNNNQTMMSGQGMFSTTFPYNFPGAPMQPMMQAQQSGFTNNFPPQPPQNQQRR